MKTKDQKILSVPMSREAEETMNKTIWILAKKYNLSMDDVEFLIASFKFLYICGAEQGMKKIDQIVYGRK